MNLKSNGISFIIGFCICLGLAYKLRPKQLPLAPLSTEESVAKTYNPETGKLIGEVITKKQTPMPQPKPSYKITLIPSYSFLDGRVVYAGLYEKRYDLPIFGDSYVGIYLNTKFEIGLSISKEF